MSTTSAQRIDSEVVEALAKLSDRVGLSSVKIASGILKDAVKAIEERQLGELNYVSFLRRELHGEHVVSDDPTLIAAINSLRYELHRVLGPKTLRAAEEAGEYGSATGPPKHGAVR